MDTYRNLSFKNILGKQWVAIYCKQAEFVIKTDDDIFVDMFATYVYTRNKTVFFIHSGSHGKALLSEKSNLVFKLCYMYKCYMDKCIVTLSLQHIKISQI
jgi:Galactosyltransferase